MKSWLKNASEIVSGGSAIIGGNRVAFFTIHLTALCAISISFIASLCVICQIVSKWIRSTSKLDLSMRFPFYLAVAEALWGISHFSDHMYLVTAQVYPESEEVRLALCINLWFFFGYQQMMHASVSCYTYFRVVHRKTINLGLYEWKLHLIWCSLLIISIFVFLYADAFGNSGYWMMYEATTINGMILGIVLATISTFNAVSTTLSYCHIKRKVMNMKAHLSSHKVAGRSSGQKPECSLATQCLATYVWMAAIFYIPLAILLWIHILFQVFSGMIEPLSSWLLVIVANCSGWGNAYAYFHNDNLRLKHGIHRMRMSIVSCTTNSTENNKWLEETKPVPALTLNRDNLLHE